MRSRPVSAIGCAAALLLAVGPVAVAQTLEVSPGGPLRSIGEAVRLASPGARILVHAGVYREPTIVIDRPLSLEGAGQAVIDGENARELLVIIADSVSVRGLVLRNVGASFIEDRAAIRVRNARDCTIAGNRLENAFFGIYLESAAGCTIEGNRLEGPGGGETATGNGIHLWYSKQVTIRDNEIRRHRDGIYFEFVEDSRVENNTSEHNFRYGLHFMFSDRCRYEDNAFRRNGAGVAVMYTRNVVMRGNRFEDNRGSAAFGLLLKDITDSHVEANRFQRNTVGLYAEGMNRVTVTGNEFVENGWAVKLMANSVDSRFTRNDFVGNTFDVATNSRRSYSTFDGNYWDAYSGYDLDGDGVGDVPFRPVRLFSLLVERHPPVLVLLRGLFVQLLDAAERVLPALTPETLVDERPVMRRAAP